MYEKIHEINNKIKEKVISAISFQNTVLWSESYIQNGQNLAPNVPVDGNHIIKSLKFSVLGEEWLRDKILVKISEIDKEENNNDASKDEDEKDNIKLEFKVRSDKKLYDYNEYTGETYYYIGEISVSIKEYDDE